MQILKNLWGLRDRWYNHPAVQMWRGYESALKEYYNTIVLEWISRGYKNNMPFYSVKITTTDNFLPNWFGRKDFHDAHKSNLLKKDTEFYVKYGWNVPLDLEYKWR